MNERYVCLIPKKDNENQVKDFKASQPNYESDRSLVKLLRKVLPITIFDSQRPSLEVDYSS